MKKSARGRMAADVLLAVSQKVSASLKVADVAGLILEESTRALGADHASLFLRDGENGRLMLEKAAGFSKDQLDNLRLLGSWEVINEHLLVSKVPLIVNDLHHNKIFRKKVLPFAREHLPIYSFIATPLIKDDAVVGALIVSNEKRPGHSFTRDDERFLKTLSHHVAIALLNAKLYEKLHSLFISTVSSLTKAIDAKDRYTSGHSERVMRYAVEIAAQMGINTQALENVRLAALLHDVGKIGVRESILYKPARLLGYEKRQMNLHPHIGARIVESIDDSEKIVRGILDHHEWFNGSGYPNRLKGTEISLDGRIIAVADTFDALTTNRPYQKRYTGKEALFVIRKGSSTQFDPRAVKAFMISFSKHPDVWKV